MRERKHSYSALRFSLPTSQLSARANTRTGSQIATLALDTSFSPNLHLSLVNGIHINSLRRQQSGSIDEWVRRTRRSLNKSYLDGFIVSVNGDKNVVPSDAGIMRKVWLKSVFVVCVPVLIDLLLMSQVQ